MRRSANAMAEAVLVSLLAGGCSNGVVTAHHARTAAGDRRRSSPMASAVPAEVTDAGLPRCPARSLVLHLGPFVSPMTGEEATLYTLTNRGSDTCTLRGYPRVVFYDASGVRLPFRYARGGGEYVTSAMPVTRGACSRSLGVCAGGEVPLRHRHCAQRSRHVAHPAGRARRDVRRAAAHWPAVLPRWPA
jgi:hypothetical protein